MVIPLSFKVNSPPLDVQRCSNFKVFKEMVLRRMQFRQPHNPHNPNNPHNLQMMKNTIFFWENSDICCLSLVFVWIVQSAFVQWRGHIIIESKSKNRFILLSVHITTCVSVSDIKHKTKISVQSKKFKCKIRKDVGKSCLFYRTDQDHC